MAQAGTAYSPLRSVSAAPYYGAKFQVSMERIPKYKKIEAILLGILIPLVLAGYTTCLAVQSEAVFWARSSAVIYHGTPAYFVSLLWFGVSALMLGHFLFRTYRILKPSSHKTFIWISAMFAVTGLVSAVVLA
jgi:hypothetical protein